MGLSIPVFLLAAGVVLGRQTERSFPIESFTRLNDPIGAIFRVEGGELRVRAPATGPLDWVDPQTPYHWLLESRERLVSDFEVGFDFELIRFGPTRGALPGEGHVELALVGQSTATLYGVNFHAGPGAPSGFRVVRYDPLPGTSPATHAQFIHFPRHHPVGRLEIHRTGAQVVFLARDGNQGTPRELVRFPYPTWESPRVRISTFQGGKNKTYVDAKLGNYQVKSGLPLTQRDGATPKDSNLEDQGDFPWVLDHSARPVEALSFWKPASDQGQAFQPEGDLIRVKPPVGGEYAKTAQAFWHRETDWSLDGDFEIELDYELLAAKPSGPEGFGVVTLGFSLESYGPLGSVTFGRAQSVSRGSQFTIVRHAPTATGGSWDTIGFPAQSGSGRLILKRKGEQFVFLVSEAHAPGSPGVPAVGPRELFRCPALNTLPLKLRISADQGANNTSQLDARINGFLIKAHRLVDKAGKTLPPPSRGSIPHLVDFEEAQTGKSPMRWFLGSVLGVLCFLVLVAFVLVRRTKPSLGQQGPGI